MKNPSHNLVVLFIATLSLWLAGCGTGYVEKDGQIYHKWVHGGNFSTEGLILTNSRSLYQVNEGPPYSRTALLKSKRSYRVSMGFKRKAMSTFAARPR